MSTSKSSATGDITLNSLNGTGCNLAPNMTIGVILPTVNQSNPFSCASGFYCPNANPSDPHSLPTMCPANLACMTLRLEGAACFPQGRYEPSICAPGYFCPDYKTRLICPSGFYCLTGSVAPTPCPMLASCPQGSITPQGFLGIVICGVIDLIIMAVALIAKLRELKQKKQQFYTIIPFIGSRLGSRSATAAREAADIDQEDVATMSLSSSTGLVLINNNLKMSASKEEYTAHDSVLGNYTSDEPGIVGPEGVFIPNRTVSTPRRATPLANRMSMQRESDLVNFFKKGLNNKDLSMNFSFSNLGLRLKSGKEVLQGVNGEIHAGRMTAIMGPSGAGKTTFMNVLMGKVAGTSGSLKVNGRDTMMHRFKKAIGYVPQEDIMLRELTVRENILHSAKCRLPPSWRLSTVESYVDTIIEALNLTHVAHIIIGDETQRGISGGQRKRVNIALELASIPLALFLDEPTSGLDSTAALQVCEILSRVSKLGITVVSVIHQPRVEIFNKFDDVLLIVPGGKTAYFGPVNKAQEYFEQLGFHFDPQANPADVLMDIMSGKSMNGKPIPFNPNKLVQIWKERGVQFKNSSIMTTEQSNDFHNSIQSVLRSRGATFFAQTHYCHMRSLNQQFRKINSFFLEIFVGMFAGAIMGLSLINESEMYQGIWIPPYSLMSPSPNEWQVPIWGLLIGITVALAAAPAGVKIYGEEKPVYWREVSSGHNSFAYYLGKFIGSVPRMAIASLHFASFYHFLAQPVISFYMQYLLILLQFFGVYGLSTIISMIVRRENGTLLAVVVSLFAAVFCGTGPSLLQASNWGVEWIWRMSFNCYAAEAQFSEYLTPYKGVFMIDASASFRGYILNQVGFDLYMIVIIGIVQRILAYFLLIGLNRDKQK